MKLVRSVVTWRIVSVCATSPRMTSWSATSPGRRTEWIGTSPSIISAVRAAVPEGASSLPAWWSSTISARSMWREASAAKRIMSTAPIAKLGATNAFAPASRGRRPQAVEVEARGADHDVHAGGQRRAGVRQRGVGLREVDEHVGAARARRPPSCRAAGRRGRSSSMPSAPSTAAHTACPMRPAAPATATRIMRRRSRPGRRRRRRRGRPARPARCRPPTGAPASTARRSARAGRPS